MPQEGTGRYEQREGTMVDDTRKGSLLAHGGMQIHSSVTVSRGLENTTRGSLGVPCMYRATLVREHK